jgi:hypothetical protein
VKGKTEFSRRLDVIVRNTHALLKEAGFRKRERTFNRTSEPGLIHVVNFQMGQYPLAPDIPPIRYSMWGSFTVNLGVFVAEVLEAYLDRRPSFVREYDCHPFSWRLGHLLDEPSDLWWDLREDLQSTSAEVNQLIRERALPLFAQFETRDQILEMWRTTGKEGRRGFTLAIVVILTARGEQAAAQGILDEYVREIPQDRSAHRVWVLETLAPRLRIDVPTAPP